MKKTLPVINAIIAFCFLFVSEVSKATTPPAGPMAFAATQLSAFNADVEHQWFTAKDYNNAQTSRNERVATISATPIIVTTGTLTPFLACAGSPSAPQSFTVSGSTLVADITLNAPSGFEISTNSGGTYSSTVTLPQTAGSVAGSIFVRLSATATGTPAGQITAASASTTTQNVAVSGMVNTPPAVTVGVITPVTTTALTFGLVYSNPVGSPTQYSVAPGTRAMSGFNRISNFSLTGSPIAISIPASAPGTYDFILTVVNGQTGCSSAPIPFTLTVNAPAPGITATGTFTTFTSCAGTASAQQSFVVSGANLTNNVTIAAPAGFELSTTTGTGFSNNILLTPTAGTITNTTVFVRLAASATTTADGNITLTATGATTQSLAVSSMVNPLPSATLGTVASINSLATNFNIPYSNISGGADRFSVSAGANAMPGFTSVNNFGLGASSVTVNAPPSAAGAYDFNFTVTNSTTGCVSAVIPFVLTVKSAVASLANLTLSSGTLSPTFASGTTGYTTTVDNIIHNLTITPTSTDAHANIQLSFNGGAFVAVGSGSASQPLALNIGSNTIDIKVTAQDGVTLNTYSIAVTRGPDPTVTASGTLAAVNTTYGAASTTPATFIASGSNLNGNINVTAPVGYELSATANGNYNASLTLTQNAGVVNSTTIFVRLSATTAAGSYSGNITLSSLGITDVVVATTLSTVNKATLTYTSAPVAKKYGDINPSFNGTVSGFVNGENLAITSGTLGFTSTAAAASGVGTYAINGFGLTASNYNFVQAAANNAALTVTPASLAYTATPVAKTYGDANPPFTGAVTGFVNGDTQAGVLSGTLSFTSIATTTSGVGSYAINGLGLVQNNNYVLIQASGNATALTVNPATLTYVAASASKTVGEANPIFTGTITGFVNNDNQAGATTGSLVWTSPATITSAPGTYAINGSGLNAVNYNFVQAAANSTKFVINDATTPTNAASNIIFNNVANTSVIVNWTNGSGNARAVFISTGNSGSPAPVNNTSYIANSAFGAGNQAGAGWYCIYNGTGNTVNVTALVAGTAYRVKVIEYNGTAGNEKYALADGVNNPLNVATTGGVIAINSITRSSAAVTNNTSVQYTVTFASNISNLQPNNFSLTTTGTLAGTSVGAVTGSGSVYTVTINTGTGSGDIMLNLANATGLTPGISTTLPFSGQAYTIDRITPDVSRLTFASNNTNTSTAKVGDVLSLNFTATEKVQTPGVSIAGHAVTANNLSEDGLNWSASYTMATGDTEGPTDFSVIFADLAGNNAGPFNAAGTHQVLTFDKTAPTITIGNPSITTTINTPVNYTVTYNDANFNNSSLSTANITLNKTGTANASSINVSGTGATRSISLSGISGVGTLGITLAAGTASDVAGNQAPSATSATFAVTSPLLANVVTDRVTTFTKITAHFSGSITDNGGVNITEKGIVYSENVNPLTSDNKLIDATAGATISADASGLSAGTIYHVRAYAINSAGTAYGDDQVFKTASDAPVVTTNPIVAFTSTTAVFSGLVNSNQGAAITEDGAVYSTNANPTVADSKLVNAGAANAIQVNASGLSAGTTYHVRAFATNVIGTSYGTDKSFTTTLSDQADLSNLVVNGLGISPAFMSGTLTYTALAGNAVSSIIVTPTAADAHAIIKVNINGGSFSTINSGSVSPALGLNVGFNTININVTAQDGTTTRTYTVNVTRDKATEVITLAPTATKTYGDTDYDAGATSSNPNIAISYVSSNAAVATIVNNKVHIVGAGIANITASQTGDANFNPAADVIQQLTVNQKVLTITANNKNKIYGYVLVNETGSQVFTANGLVNAETVGTVNIEYNTGKAANAAVGIYTLQVRPFQATGGTFNSANYNITYVNGNIIVGAMPVTITADVKTKIYGDADPTLTYALAKGALVGTDTFTGALTRDAGENVGTYAIKQSTLALNSNYTLTYIGANLTIGTKAVTVTAIAKNKIYGDADPALTFANTALVGTDAFTGALTRDAGENVSTYAIKQGTLTLNSNYTLTYMGANLIIGTKAIAVTAIAKNKIYGDADPALTFTNAALVGTDSFTGALTRDAGENVGSYTIKQGTLALNSNYTLTYTGANLTIGTRNLTVIADNKTKVYGDVNPVLTATYTGFVNGDNVNSLTTPVSLTTAAIVSSNAGTYSISASGAVAANYNIGYTAGTLTVNKASLTITADNKTKVVNTANPVFTATYAGFVNGDSNISLITQPSLTTTATMNSPAGTYPITALGALATNYNINYVAGTLTVTNAKTLLIVSVNAASKGYGSPNPAFSVTYTGFLNGDTPASLTTQPTITTVATKASGAGTYAITAGGAVSAKYTFFYLTGTLTINKVPLNVTADDKSRTFGQANPPLTVRYTGFTNGDNQNNLTTPAIAGTNATITSPPGMYPIVPAEASSPNYTFTYNSGTLTIVPANNNASLNNIFASQGSLSPVFNPNTFSYQLTIPVTASAATIEPVAADPAATVRANGVLLTSSAKTVSVLLNTTLTIVVTAADGHTQHTYTVAAKRGLVVPALRPLNVLSPNGDSKNDSWTVDNIQSYPNNTVTIYDAAGRVVYSKKGYNGDWDGTLKGAPLSQGVYYYMIDLGPGYEVVKGSITILKSR